MFSGSYIEPGYGSDDRFEAPWDLRNNMNRIIHNTSGSIVGYKYFNFDKTSRMKDLQLRLRLVPEGVDGTITVWADRPWASQGGEILGTAGLSADMPKESCELCIDVAPLVGKTGKHAIFLAFSSETADKSLCSLESLVFSAIDER